MRKSVFLFILVFVLLASFAAAGDYYIAGAYVKPDSKAFLNILNPGDGSADIDVALYFEKNDSSSFGLKADPHSSMKVDLSRFASGSFGAVVSSDQSLVIDSVQYDTTYSAGFGSLAALEPGFVWYFCEGYSSGMVKTYLHILNPGSREANVGVTLYYDNGEKKTFNLHVPASRHLRVDLKEKTMPEKRFGMKVTSTAPIVASAGNFNKHFSAGTGGLGSSAVEKRWFFPEGYTSVDATEFLNILNPSLGVAHLTVTFYYDDGTTGSFDETVPANSKKMFLLNNHVSELRWFSTVVASDVNIAAELTHYDASYSAGHGGLGATVPAVDFHFSSGMADNLVKSYLAVFNPSDKEADLELTFYYSDGSVKTLSEKAPSLMRSTVDLNKKAVAGKGFGLRVESSEPVFVKEIVYDKTYSAGYSYLGLSDLVPVEEEEVIVLEEPEEAAEPGVEYAEEYTLVKESVVSASKFKDAVSSGLEKVVKYSYIFNGSNLYAWYFNYADSGPASEALDAVISGSLFRMLEVFPSDVSGQPAYSFVAEKSEGYIWLNGSEIYVFVAGDSGSARGLAETFASDTPAEKRMGLVGILLVLAALIALVIIIRWLFKRSPGKTEEGAVWEEMIPSAKPVEKKPKKRPVRKPKNKPKKKQAMPKKKPKKEKPMKKEKPVRKEAKHKESEQKVEPKFTEEVTHTELPEEIPEYEDVFRHVNREYEEIKPK